jgi:hypothetical protein
MRRTGRDIINQFKHFFQLKEVIKKNQIKYQKKPLEKNNNAKIL